MYRYKNGREKNKMDTIKLNKSTAPKELYVRVVKLSQSKNPDIDLSKLKEEYDKEKGEIKSWNIFSGGGIGASIGLIACLASNIAGIPITSPETFTIVAGSLIFGTIAGFILY